MRVSEYLLELEYIVLSFTVSYFPKKEADPVGWGKADDESEKIVHGYRKLGKSRYLSAD